METAYLMLGSNLGDRLQNLRQALELIPLKAGHVRDISPVYETEPWNARKDLPFLNMAVCIETELCPTRLLSELLGIEKEMGRIRDGSINGPRPIDIDILLYGKDIIDVPGLQIPHPRMHLRRFVLVPLNEIAAAVVHPGFGKSVNYLLGDCSDQLPVSHYKDLKSAPAGNEL